MSNGRSKIEQVLLKKVENEVAARLSHSLHNGIYIITDKEEDPSQVKPPWASDVEIGSLPTFKLPPDTIITDIYNREDIEGKLLILGAPGSGKTMTLLDLARPLIDKAIQDNSYPIPVFFSLSSWGLKASNQVIPAWLIEELYSKYGVRKEIGKKLIEEKKLLPMLDGLDEVKPEHQESCVEFINQWLQGESCPLCVVVCCRQKEYANYKTRLYLNGAIVLQELKDEQIQAYLSDVKRVELWSLLQQDAVLLELVRTPLLLRITFLSSYEELSLQKWQQNTSKEQRVKLLLDTYVQKMLGREIIESKAYRKLLTKLYAMLEQ